MQSEPDQPLILVVDDEPHVTLMVSKRLLKNGYQVQQAHDGLEALELAQKLKPNLILTDYQMPNMNGLTLAQKLFEQADTQHIALVMLTARGHKIPDDELSKTNIKKLIAKPFSGAQALEVVTNILNQSTPSSQSCQSDAA